MAQLDTLRRLGGLTQSLCDLDFIFGFEQRGFWGLLDIEGSTGLRKGEASQ
jgi:hypothetical protein